MLRFLIVVSFIKFPVPTMIFHWKSSMHSTATKVVYVTCNRSTYIFHLTGEVVNLGLKLWRSIIIANLFYLAKSYINTTFCIVKSKPHFRVHPPINTKHFATWWRKISKLSHHFWGFLDFVEATKCMCVWWRFTKCLNLFEKLAAGGTSLGSG